MAITKPNPTKHDRQKCKTYVTSAQRSRSTVWRHNRGRPSKKDKAANQQYLSPCEEKALIEYVLQSARNGYPISVKSLRLLAQAIRRQRSSHSHVLETNDNVKPPGKNWPQGFYRRHPEVRSKRVKALDWSRHDLHIRDKIVEWFDVVGPILDSRDVLPENVYNMDETGVMLCFLTSKKVLIGHDDPTNYRGAGVKRDLVTGIECVSVDGRALPPLIIWPASTHRSNWTTYPTPGWHFACSESGRTNKAISLYWIQHVFDPSTRAPANGRPRVLINDGFGSHESEEILKFCFENNIILCRLPSHTSHKLQPCDVGVFGPLKAAYREQVENLYRGGANTVGKQHFTLLYSRARDAAFTRKNIQSAWSKAGLHPFNPDRVLNDIRPAPTEETRPHPQTVNVDLPSPTELLTTPTTFESIASLSQKLEQDIGDLDSPVKRRFAKFRDAVQTSRAHCTLLQAEKENLIKQNDERKTRVSTRSTVIGRAKIMTYDDLVAVRNKRGAEESGIAGRARKSSKRRKTGPNSCQSPKASSDAPPQAKEVEKGVSEIEAMGLESYCSVLRF